MGLSSRRKPQAQRTDVVRTAPRIDLRLVTGVVLAGAVLGATLWGAQRLADPGTLPIRSVRIQGKFQHLDTAQLQEAVSGTVTGGFFTVDVAAVKAAAHSVPWADQVSVRRIWPDTLLIQVVEQVPLARWGEDGLVNVRGERFAVSSQTIPQGLPELRGPVGLEGAITATYYEMGKALAPAGLEIARLMQDERRAWRITLDNGIELKLGRNHAFEHLLRLVRVYPGVLAERAVAIREIDLRYTNGFAVRWSERPADLGATVAPGKPG
jgi:cell division protein FtsQ